MKTIIRYWIIPVIAIQLMLSCSLKKKEQDDSNEWPEMAAFHKVMAAVYHPYKDSANLGAVRNRAEEMSIEAERWAASSIPGPLNNEDMKSRLQKLKSDSRLLADEIKAGASDERVGQDLTSLHDSFHAIMEASHSEKDHDAH